jgi:hypothetical protein
MDISTKGDTMLNEYDPIAAYYNSQAYNEIDSFSDVDLLSVEIHVEYLEVKGQTVFGKVFGKSWYDRNAEENDMPCFWPHRITKLELYIVDHEKDGQEITVELDYMDVLEALHKYADKNNGGLGKDMVKEI